MSEPRLQVRRAPPVLAALLLSLVAVAAWVAAERSEGARNRELVQAQAESVVARAAGHVQQLAEGLDRAALRWAGIDQLGETMATIESAILLRDPLVARVAWLDTDLDLLWAFGPAGPEPTGELQRWIDANDAGWREALEARSTTIGPVLGDPRQRPVLPVSIPIRMGSGIEGVLVVAHDAAGLLESALPAGGDFLVSVRDAHGRTVLETGRSEPGTPSATAELARGPLQLTVSVSPTGPTWARMRSSTPGIVLVGGLAFAVLTGLAMHLGQVQGLRARQDSMLGALRREVDARIEAEQQLAQRADALERSNADLSRFAHMISHDLRAPLNVMDMHLQLLAERQLEERPARHVEAARAASKRMVEMIDGLLDYARVDTSDGDERVDVAEAAEAALRNLEQSIAAARAEVALGELPTVRGRRQQLVQLFQNLVGNAVRHRGDEAPRVSIGCEVKGAHWLFRIDDNGPGIAPSEAERIFGLFESGGGTAGSGVGLAICRRIVEAQGGRIWHQPRPGGGTSMLFTWPRRGPLDQEEAASSASDSSSPDSSASRYSRSRL